MASMPLMTPQRLLMHRIVLPILDANMTHGVVRAWLKREGEAVRAGEPLFEVETDKINAEVEAEVSGVLRRIVAPEGTRVAVLGLLAFVGSADEAVPAPETWSAPASGRRRHSESPSAPRSSAVSDSAGEFIPRRPRAGGTGPPDGQPRRTAPGARAWHRARHHSRQRGARRDHACRRRSGGRARRRDGRLRTARPGVRASVAPRRRRPFARSPPT